MIHQRRGRARIAHDTDPPRHRPEYDRRGLRIGLRPARTTGADDHDFIPPERSVRLDRPLRTIYFAAVLLYAASAIHHAAEAARRLIAIGAAGAILLTTADQTVLVPSAAFHRRKDA